MPTVSTYLKMMDQFSQPLQRVSNGVQTAIETMSRLKRVAETPVTMSVDTSKAVDSINQTKAQLENTGGTSAIQIAINSQTIAQELNNVRNRVQSGLSSAAVQVALDAQPAMQATSEAREQIAAALGTIEVATRLDIPTQLPMIQPQAVEVPVQLDQAGATAQWQSFRNQVLIDGLPTLTLEIDAEKAVTSIERAREKIGISGSTAIELALNVQDIVRKVADVKQRIVSELSQAIVHVTLDKQQALTEAANLRMQINDTVGQIDLHPKFELPQASEVGSRLSRMLDGVSPTITAKLAFDPHAAFTEINRAIAHLESISVTLKAAVNASGVAADVDRIKQQIALVDSLAIRISIESDIDKATAAIEQFHAKISNGGSSVIELALNVQDILAKVSDLKQRIKSDLSEALVHVTLDKQQALADAASISTEIARAVEQVELKLAFEPNAAYEQIHQVTRQLQGVQIGLQVTMDARSAVAETEQIKEQIAQSKPIQLSVLFSTENAVAAIERLRERITANGSTVVELALNARDIISKVAELKNKILSELSDAIVKVTIDRQQTLVDAAALRSQIQSALGQIQLKPTIELPQMDDLKSKISNDLKGIAANVAFKFTIDSAAATGQINKVLDQLGTKAVSLTASLDATGAMAEVDRIKQKIDSASSSAIDIILDEGSVTKGLQEIQQRLQSELAGTMLQVTLDKQQIHAEAATLHKQLSDALGQVALTAKLDATGAITEVERLKQRIETISSSESLHITPDKQQALADAANIRADIVHAIGQIEIKPIVEISEAQIEKLISLENQLRSAIEEATKAQESFNEQISAPLPLPEIPQAPVMPPTPAPTWEAWTAPEIFQSSGVERYTQEIEDLQVKMSNLASAQQALDMSDTSFLPSGAAGDISALQQRLQNLGTMLQKVESQKDSLSSSADPEVFESLNASAEKIRGSIQQAVDQQEALNKAMKAGDLSSVQQAYSNLNSIIDNTEIEIRNNTKEQERFNKSVENGEKAANGLLGKILGFVGAYAGVKTIKDFFQAGKAAASEQIGVEQRLQTIMGNINGMTQDGIELVKQRARELEATTAISAGVGIAGQSQLAEYVYDPTNIAGMTEAMYNLATETYGANVSADQLQQTANLMGKVMMGDINALSRNGFKIDAIFTEAEQKLLKTGTEAERAAMVIAMIDENLSGLAEAMGNTPEGQALRLASAWGSVQEKIGYGLIPLIIQFSSFLLANMSTIQAITTTVFGNLINLLTDVLQIGMEIGTYLIENWSWIEPVIWGVAAAITAYTLATKAYAIQQAIATAAATQGTIAFAVKTLVTKGAAAAWRSLNAAMKANIIILIISLLIALGVWLYNLWQKNDNFAAGLMRAWNAILNFFDQVPIFFVKVGLGIVNALFDMRAESLKIMDGLINGIIDGINWLINKSNTLLGTSFDVLDHVNLAATAEIEAKLVRKAGNDVIADMQANAANKAAEREQKVLDMLEDRAAKRERDKQKKDEQFQSPGVQGNAGTGAWDVGDGRLPDIGKVKQVDKIKDSVDISSEDLKMMRELAEMKNIQNFVTLQPSISFGDTHVQRESDINTIVARITDKLNEDIATSVDAVYT